MPRNISILKKRFSQVDLDKIRPSIRKAMEGWEVKETYRGQTVRIPGTWNAEIYPYKYFEVYKVEGDPNPGESENEIQCYLSCGWRGADDEVVIVLMILGADVNGSGTINAEIFKFGGAPMWVYRHGKLITDFKRKWWRFWTIPQDKVWVGDVR